MADNSNPGDFRARDNAGAGNRDPIQARRRDTSRRTSALSAETTHFGLLFENMPIMYFRMDAEGVVLSVNPFGAQQLGYQPAELLGRPVLEVFHEEDRTRVLEQFRAIVGNPGGVASWEFRKIRKDGSMLWVQESARAFRAADGSIEVIVVCEDVTQRKLNDLRRIEDQRRLRKLSMELVRAEEGERNRISADLHDNLGQTLAAVCIKLDRLILKDSAETEALRETRKLLDDAVQSTRTLAFDMASPVLHASGLVAGLGDLCRRMSSTWDTRFRLNAGSVPKIPEEVGILLYRAVRELMINVVKHSGGQQAQIEVDAERDRIRISVTDDGRGFDPATLVHDEELPGFGLYSIRERLAQIGGEVEIFSSPGRGTRISLYAPVLSDSWKQ